jgi:peptide deformylase
MPDEWIRQWGDPTLRQTAAAVESFDELLEARARRLAAQLRAAEGAGLAATQVGFMRRLFAYRLDVEDEIEVLVNPTVVSASRERATFIEGCLSYRSILLAVERPLAVHVEAWTTAGRRRMIEAEGPLASLLQHEIDHLDGILTLDRAQPAERRRAIVQLMGDGRAEAREAA